MKNYLIFIPLFLISNIVFGQFFEDDKELYNLNGNVEYIFYDKYYTNHDPNNLSRYNNIAYNFYLHFDEHGKIDSYGNFEKDSITGERKIIITHNPKNLTERKVTDENIYETISYHRKGFYKNHLSFKRTYDSRANCVTEFNSIIDTTDLGYQILNTRINDFSQKEHTRYKFLKTNKSFYNSKKELIKLRVFDIYGLLGPSQNSNDKYDYTILFKYNEFSDITQMIIDDQFQRSESYSYEYDKNDNWIQKTVICDECTFEKDRVKDIIFREIIYRE
ncbi:hypothetical protein JCM19314_1960 [Nonlabens ulvanivorans]|uniref:Uncharacterized protein n=1 Tax=Nonlabens ulvanivorans TaxID=906888 RepID=A0A090QY49_NONUL|nr:hypothetical protein [Nonlabens ulvanivorans]GAL00352.1 hypothetical protein JCM19314_1960 [Nonlabens ulvanivorans]